MQHEPVYDPDAAAEVTYRHLPEAVRQMLSREDVALILELEFQYQQEIGLVGGMPHPSQPPVDIDSDELIDYIQREADAHGRSLRRAEIAQVLDAELKYLEIIGAVGPPSERQPGPGFWSRLWSRFRARG